MLVFCNLPTYKLQNTLYRMTTNITGFGLDVSFNGFLPQHSFRPLHNNVLGNLFLASVYLCFAQSALKDRFLLGGLALRGNHVM